MDWICGTSRIIWRYSGRLPQAVVADGAQLDTGGAGGAEDPAGAEDAGGAEDAAGAEDADDDIDVQSGSPVEAFPDQDGSPIGSGGDAIEAVSDEFMGSAELADYLNDVQLDEDFAEVDPWQEIRRQGAAMPPELPPLPDERPVPDWDLLEAQFGHLRQFLQSNTNEPTVRLADVTWEALRARWPYRHPTRESVRPTRSPPAADCTTFGTPLPALRCPLHR